MLNAFKIKEFDLQPIYEEWKDGPVFSGQTDVEEWLDKIKEGCAKRGVPEEYWYKVAQHFMGPKAKARLDELKQVITKVHGAKYRWTWKKFRVAMLNMGWSIDMDKKETIKVRGRGSGMWFTRRKDTEASTTTSDLPHDPPSTSKLRPASSRSSLSWIGKQSIVEDPEEEPEPQGKPQVKANTLPRRRPSRSNTIAGFWPGRMNSSATQSKDEPSVVPRPKHQKTRSETEVVQKRSGSPDSTVSTTSNQEEVITTKAEAPAWLLNAFTALEYITSENPKTMSIISAILITAGAIPAIPAIAAGAGGAVLASSTAHAIGAIAVAAGQALGAGVAHSQKKQSQGGSTSSITDGHH